MSMSVAVFDWSADLWIRSAPGTVARDPYCAGIVSFTAAKTNLMFEVSVACVRLGVD